MRYLQRWLTWVTEGEKSTLDVASTKLEPGWKKLERRLVHPKRYMILKQATIEHSVPTVCHCWDSYIKFHCPWTLSVSVPAWLPFFPFTDHIDWSFYSFIIITFYFAVTFNNSLCVCLLCSWFYFCFQSLKWQLKRVGWETFQKHKYYTWIHA